jgi:DNA-binding Lrp family transcriptional regulator
VSILFAGHGREHDGNVANNDYPEPVPAPRRGDGRDRVEAPRRLRAAPRPEAKTVVVGSPVQAVVRVRLAPGASRREFEQYLGKLACVRCAWQVTGDVDYELLAACPVVADLDDLLACLRGCSGTEVASTELVLRELRGPAAGRAHARVRAAANGSSQ